MQLAVISAVFISLLIGESLSVEGLDRGQAWMGGDIGGFRSAALVAGSIILLWSLMRISAMKVVLRMKRAAGGDRRVRRLPARFEMLTQVMLLGTFVLQLTACGWGKLVYVEARLQRLVMIDEFVMLLPFVLMLLLKWHCVYPINRFIREGAITEQLMDGLSARPVWSRGQYISFQARHGLLIILVPMLLIVGFKDVVEYVTILWFSQGDESINESVSLVSMLVVVFGAGMIFLFSPLLLRRIWRTRTLPDGPLRSRLQEFCVRIRLGYRDILLWDTYSAVANAAVMGLLRPVRYVMLSDALIENMPDDQIEAVFGHEAGHVKHHHIMFLVLFVLGSSSLIVHLLGLAGHYGGEWINSTEFSPDIVGWALHGVTAFFVVGWILLFGFVSRRFERQADVHAAMVLETRNSSETREEQKDCATLGERGAFIMSSALHRIAFLNGIPMETRSWRHSSIRSRMAFLQELAVQGGGLRRFNRKVTLIKIMILFGVLAAVAGWWFLSGY